MWEEEKALRFDALVVLGAVMAWNKKRKQWAFPTIIPHYAGKLVMGKARALAAREIQDCAPLILVTGGSDRNPVTGDLDSRAIELSKLIKRYGVPENKVFPIGTMGASHTKGNVENLAAFLKERPEVLQTRRIIILCQCFQRERAELMFQSNPFFRKHGIVLDWITVEEVLAGRSPRYKKWADGVYATKEAAINQRLEQEGIRDFLMGTYKVKS